MNVRRLFCLLLYLICIVFRASFVLAQTTPTNADCMNQGGNYTCINNTNSIPAEEYISGSDCKSVTGFQSELTKKCLTCELFATIVRAAQDISRSAFTATVDGLTGLLVVAFLIFIAYQTLITIASPEAQKISKYLTTLLIQGFKVALTVLILKNPSFLYGKALGPILEGSVEFGLAMSGTAGTELASIGAKYAGQLDQGNEYLDAKTMQDLVGATDVYSAQAALVPAVGRTLICRAFDDLPWYHFKIFPRVSMFLEGAIIYVFGLLIWLAIGFYLLDCAVALCYVCALMAFFVACWPFKQTSGYTQIGWNMFLNVFFNFIMMSVVITTIIALSTQALSGGMPLEEFLGYVNGDDVDSLDKIMDLAGLSMIMILACAMICLKIAKESAKLANRFAGGVQVSLGGQLGGMIASTTTNLAIGKNALTPGRDGKRQLGGAAGLLWKGAKNAGGSIAEHSGLKGKANAVKSSLKNKVDGFKGRIGIGSQAKMGAKGRDQNANQQRGTDNGFKQDH